MPTILREYLRGVQLLAAFIVGRLPRTLSVSRSIVTFCACGLGQIRPCIGGPFSAAPRVCK
jgi:hypothetical protein